MIIHSFASAPVGLAFGATRTEFKTYYAANRIYKDHEPGNSSGQKRSDPPGRD
jgi:hypothetical protein